jgi:hypothetical protein
MALLVRIDARMQRYLLHGRLMLRLTTFSVFQEDGHGNPSRHHLVHIALFTGIAPA